MNDGKRERKRTDNHLILKGALNSLTWLLDLSFILRIAACYLWYFSPVLNSRFHLCVYVRIIGEMKNELYLHN